MRNSEPEGPGREAASSTKKGLEEADRGELLGEPATQSRLR